MIDMLILITLPFVTMLIQIEELSWQEVILAYREKLVEERDRGCHCLERTGEAGGSGSRRGHLGRFKLKYIDKETGNLVGIGSKAFDQRVSQIFQRWPRLKQLPIQMPHESEQVAK
ncbi:YicC family protein [Babesia caballi]|uniref:YicC family protein n=1 Tax=Babesia caballi TaxID=5871 RepID=A0AAV4LNP2_BABCB|nr:YicC family protein [Babesia caballi]